MKPLKLFSNLSKLRGLDVSHHVDMDILRNNNLKSYHCFFHTADMIRHCDLSQLEELCICMGGNLKEGEIDDLRNDVIRGNEWNNLKRLNVKSIWINLEFMNEIVKNIEYINLQDIAVSKFQILNFMDLLHDALKLQLRDYWIFWRENVKIG